jgi:hypothetical protein
MSVTATFRQLLHFDLNRVFGGAREHQTPSSRSCACRTLSAVHYRNGSNRFRDSSQRVPRVLQCTRSRSVNFRNRESRATHLLAKAMEEGKNLERNLEELHGVWGAECHHSGCRNKRDLRWSVAHNYRKPRYLPQGDARRRRWRSRRRPYIRGGSRQHNSAGGESLYFYRAQRGGK